MWFGALRGRHGSSGVTRTHTERLVCYTISYSKLACGMGKGWEKGLKLGVLVETRMSHLDFLCCPHRVLRFNCQFHLAEEADGSDVESKLLVRVPKVIEHDIDDWNLIDFGSVQLQHSLSVTFPCLQEDKIKGLD